MQGFTDKALIICPKIATYDSRNLDYQIKLLDSIKSLIRYFKSRGIQPYCIYTDELSHELPIDVKWASPVNRGDAFFIKNNVDGFDSTKEPEFFATDKIDTIANKFKVERGMSVEDRFEILLKREVRGVKVLMEEFKIIAAFHHPNNPSFKMIQSEENDGRLIITVDHVAFLAEAMMSGMQIEITSITQLESAKQPLYNWEV